MDHKEFIEKYKKGKLDVLVNKSLSLKTISLGYLPKRYYWAHTFWSWVWMISIPVGIVYLFLNTFIGILILFFVSFLGGRAVKKSASEFVLEHALENEKFYDFAIKSTLLEVHLVGEV